MIRLLCWFLALFSDEVQTFARAKPALPTPPPRPMRIDGHQPLPDIERAMLLAQLNRVDMYFTALSFPWCGAKFPPPRLQ